MSKSFSPHLAVAHNYWRAHLHPTDTVFDMTCGNGYDTEILCTLVLEGAVYAFDIQAQAIEETRKKTTFHPNITLLQASHDTIDQIEAEPRLVVYNLGYLPGGDKSIVTETSSTLASLQKALKQLAPDGAISIMCYPGHEEGAREEKTLLHFLEGLASHEWRICYHKWINRPASPTLLWIVRETQKKKN